MDILELTSAGNQTVRSFGHFILIINRYCSFTSKTFILFYQIGTWHNDELTITRSYTSAADITEETIMKNKTFKVLISKVW